MNSNNDIRKAELKIVLANSLMYILNDSPFKEYHRAIYLKAVTEFNRILAREAK